MFFYPSCHSLSTRSLLVTARFIAALGAGAATHAAAGQVMQYGDQDLCNTGTYTTDPTLGATLTGLAPGVVTPGAPAVGHVYPFAPAGDFPGTDQIYVGSVQTGAHDGYSTADGRLNGPMILALDYSSLVPAGTTVDTFTLGLAFDDFQEAVFLQPYIVTVNGQAYAPLNALASSLDQSGPVTRFFTIGLPVSLLDPSNVITISIDQGGDGGDGFAMDFATVGVTTIPGPSALPLLTLGVLAVRRRRR